MAKFKVLEINQLIMTRLGIYSFNLTEPTNEFFKSFCCYYFSVALALCAILSGMYVCSIWHDQAKFRLALEAIIVSIGCIQSLGAYLNVGFNMKKVKALHMKLQNMVDKGESEAIEHVKFIQQFNSFITAHLDENEKISETYWGAEKACRKTTKLMFGYIIFHEQVFVASLIYSIYCICGGNTDTSKWPLVFNLVTPLDVKTVSGWLTMWFYQLNVSICYTLSTVSTISYFICCCYYITTIRDHFKLNIDSIKEFLSDRRFKNDATNDGNQFGRIKQQLHEAIEIHVNMFE